MFSQRLDLFLLIFIFCSVKICASSEFVPVYMWETQNTDQPIAAMQRISESSFKETLLEKLNSNPLIVVFAEETLSPEDFAQHDQNGKTPFKALHKFLELSNVVYRPYVQNPIGAIKQLDKAVTEISIASLLRNFNVPKDEVLIVDLNDAKDDEPRTDLLRRHDAAISEVFEKLFENNENILALYTAHHPSWIVPEEIKHRNLRSLLEENDTAPVHQEKQVKDDKDKDKTGIFITDDKLLLLYVSSLPKVSDNGGITFKNVSLTTDNVAKNGTDIELTLSGDGYSYNFEITFSDDGYWTLSNVTFGKSYFNVSDIYAPYNFSYHCVNTTFNDGQHLLTLPGLQLQPFQVEDAAHVFSDPYDCVGFTTIPIWTGLLVTILLLSILTFGITLMMDIRTMDKFDDAKGKTITINVSE